MEGVTMKSGAAVEKMIKFYNGNLHDINHFLKVYAYAKTIGELEKLDAGVQEILELAAVVHDIACPICREKYGSTNGKYQAADFLVNADESAMSEETVIEVMNRVFKTKTGIRFLKSVYRLSENKEEKQSS